MNVDQFESCVTISLTEIQTANATSIAVVFKTPTTSFWIPLECVHDNSLSCPFWKNGVGYLIGCGDRSPVAIRFSDSICTNDALVASFASLSSLRQCGNHGLRSHVAMGTGRGGQSGICSSETQRVATDCTAMTAQPALIFRQASHFGI
jgi:hypothetical protein